MTTHSETKRLPVGIESFEKIRQEGFYYVDKTSMIRDLLNKWGEVNLFTRPRRFGKSLNMSMLQSFLEVGCDKTLFNGLEISNETDLCEQYMGKFPVISVSLKGIDAPTYEEARSLAVKLINEEARRLRFLLESPRLNPEDKKIFSALLEKDMPDSTFSYSLRELSELLRKHYDQKVIILIDEYDVPLAKANDNGYYDQMLNLIRSLFHMALKTNDNLYFAVLTGCLRISQESIFTGLNNVKVLSVTDVQFDEYFGFTDKEVREMLSYYNIFESYEDVKKWYDGYRFGDVEVYCPWDVISYCDKRKEDLALYPESYWSNTSGNTIIRHLLEKATAVTRNEIERLIAGESIIKEIKKELTYAEIYDSIENIWSVLFTTGYLTLDDNTSGSGNSGLLSLKIPNEEIRHIFLNQIQNWMQEIARKSSPELESFCRAIKTGDSTTVERMFSSYLERTISIRDTASRDSLKENFYHGFLLGILRYQEDWLVLSNRESSQGYSDILIEIYPEKIGIIIELKYAQKSQLDSACQDALNQINEKDYAAVLREDGMQTILKYAIACRYKQCRVIVEK